MEESNGNEQRSSIKLIKNTKGYQWEIKVYMNNEDDMSYTQSKEFLKDTTKEIGFKDETLVVDNVALKRIDLINRQLKEKYGNED